MFSETVVVLVTGSGLARGAGTMLRRLVVRVALLIGFTAGAWLAGALLAGPASADVRLPIDLSGLNLDGGSSPQQPAATKSKSANGAKSAKSGDQGLLGGLVDGLVGTVDTTVSTVSTTVNNTLTTVTTTVDKTLGTVTKTVNNVVTDVAKLPDKILSPPDLGIDMPLLPEPVADLLDPGQTSGSDATETETETTRMDAVDAVPAAETPAVAPVEAAPLAADVVTAPERLLRASTTTQSVTYPVRVGFAPEKAAPTDNRPGPLPSPTAPVAPAAPCPTFTSGGNGGSDARGTLAVLPLQTQLIPPSAGRLNQQHFAAEQSRCAGLPATPPD